MNKQVAISLFLILFFQIAVIAQDCEFLKAYKKGTKIQTTYYDKKGKIEQIADGVVEEIKNSATGWNMTLKMLAKNEKGKAKTTGSMEFKCEKGVFFANLLNFSDYISSVSKDTNMTVTVTGDLPQYSNLEVGKTQPDASLEFAAALGGFTLMKIKCNAFNRNITAFEKVTTSAGTFDCYKIEYDVEMKMLIRTIKLHAVEFFNKDYGCIKTISFDKKGQEEGHTELTKFQE